MADQKYFLDYEEGLLLARKAFKDEISFIQNISDQRLLHLFWINYCGLGVGMTQNVESWIKRAGENSIEKGFSEIGKLLIKHAKQESGHELMMIKDTENLIYLWNNLYSDKLDISVFNDVKDQSQSVQAYAELHEGVIVSDYPFAQIAIEYEIENLSIEHGPKIIAHSQKVMGPKFIECLSFVEHHIVLDEGHTNFNKSAITKFLDKNPSKLGILIDTGKKALKSYQTFMFEVYERANTYEQNKEKLLN